MSPWLAAGLLLILLSTATTHAAPAQAEDVAPRFDGRSAQAFAESVAAIEADLNDAQRLAFRLKLLQARDKLAEQHGRALTDQELATALDGKSVAELAELAEAAPVLFRLEIEDPDDT